MKMVVKYPEKNIWTYRKYTASFSAFLLIFGIKYANETDKGKTFY